MLVYYHNITLGNQHEKRIFHKSIHNKNYRQINNNTKKRPLTNVQIKFINLKHLQYCGKQDMKNYVYVPHMSEIPEWKQCYYDYKTLYSILDLLNTCASKIEFMDGKLNQSFSKEFLQPGQSLNRLEQFQGAVVMVPVPHSKEKQQLLKIIEIWCREFVEYSDQSSEMVSIFVNMKQFQVIDRYNEYKKFYLIVRSEQRKITSLLENLYMESSYLSISIQYNIARENMVTQNFQNFQIKHQEYCQNMMFASNQKLRRLKRINRSLLSQIQTQYILHSQQDTRQAIQTLQSLHNKRQLNGSRRQLKIGVVMGVLAFMVLVLSITDYVSDIKIQVDQVFHDHFPIWRGASYILFYLWLLATDIFFYEKSQINYRLIFQFKNHNMPESKRIYQSVSILTLIYIILFYVFTLQIRGNLSTNFLDFGIIFWGIMIFSTIIVALISSLPFSSAQAKKKGRYLLFKLLRNVILTPCIPITFMIIWTTEQLSSFNQPFGDLYYTICFVATHHAPSCSSTSPYASTSYIMTIFMYRMIQNLKLWHQITMKKPDKKYDFKAPQFLGFFRGLFAFCTSLFSLLDRLKLYHGSFEVWLVFSIVTTLYSWFIDIRFDWGILNIHEKNCLRQKLLFPKAKAFYYFIAFFNLVLRAAWILNISSLNIVAPGFSNLLFTMGISYLQIFRRGIWNILRIQNQHIKNCGEFRATITDQEILQQVREAVKQKQQKLKKIINNKENIQKNGEKVKLQKKLSNALEQMSIIGQQQAKLSQIRTKQTKELFKQSLKKLADKKVELLSRIKQTQIYLNNFD